MTAQDRATTADRSTGSAGMRAALVAAFVVIVAVRIPAAVLPGRFWAEEGVTFFHDAWTLPWSDALFAVHAGYLNLPASLAALVALHAVPLEHAPLVTGLMGLAVQTLPALLIVGSRIPWLQGWPTMAAALATLLAPGGGAEVWMNTITSQFHLALCAGLILAMDTRRGAAGALHGLVLLSAPLAGPIGGSLAPLFLLRAALDRSAARLVQAALLAAPLLLQVALVLSHPVSQRSSGIGPTLLLAVAGLQEVMLPLVGEDWMLAAAGPAADTFARGGIPVLPVVAAMAGLGGLGLAAWRHGTPSTRWLFVGGCTLTFVGYSFALTLGQPSLLLVWLGGRYAFAPTVLLSLGLLGLAVSGTRRQRMVPAMLAGLLLATGGLGYFGHLARFSTGADWPGEVARWRRDPATPLRMWPEGWLPYLSLDPTLRR